MPLNDDELLIAAGLDDELDAATSLALQRRLDADPAFRAAWDAQRALRAAVRERASYHAAPEGLRAELEAALGLAMPADTVAMAETVEPAANDERADAPSVVIATIGGSPVPAPRRPVRAGFAARPWGYAFGGALAATLATLLVVDPGALRRVGEAPGTQLALATTATEEAEAVNAHARAILVGQPIEVVSSDQHTVRPWLSAHLSFVPQVTDFAPQGYPLAGARRDVIAGETTAVLVYRHGAHVVSVFVRPAATADAESAPASAALRGYNVIEMAHAGMRYCLVSDMNPHELADLAGLLRHPPGG